MSNELIPQSWRASTPYRHGALIIDDVADAPKLPPYRTIGVRYLRGPNLEKSYTYRIRKGAKVHLGQEVVVPVERDGYTANTVAVVVELHKTKQDNGPYKYKFVTGTVKPL